MCPRITKTTPKLLQNCQNSRFFSGNACHFRKFFLIRARLRFFLRIFENPGKGQVTSIQTIKRRTTPPRTGTAHDSTARVRLCARLKKDVIKGEEAKRVATLASGGRHFRATSDELGLPVH